MSGAKRFIYIKTGHSFRKKQAHAFVKSMRQIVDKIPKWLLVLGFCHPFSVTLNPCSLGRPSIGADFHRR
ncbi:hypothetical protein BLMD_05955 [Bacillus paralicheniformis]|nr:hypothetical protein BLMD_05955 [Bacillus paralicheniformis]AYQ15676.1 hypothetical protein D5285_06170 [Bacillus paralicheniformis]OMI13348.1 hypothetical protein BVL54_02585 [Bacillus paralicheniformis]OPF73673.1 hypothetical protein BVF99_12190 [Bacillus paralicheniformis]QEO06351.1 hypothetical protein FLQ07_12620 [Bacillus paralicheniformis]